MIPKKNRSFRPLVLAALLCGSSAASLLAQGPGGPGPGGHGGHHGPPPNPLFDALDTNHDGVISAEEMSNASASLKGLLKNGATELKREDLRPMRPEAGPGADDRPNADAARPHHGPPALRAHRPPPPDEQAAPEADDRPEAAARPEVEAHHGLPPRPEAAPRADGPAPHPDRARDPQARGPEDRDGHGPRHHGPPPSPIFDALDTNHDGILSAEEMDAASTTLKSLLKTGATELRREDLRPMHPPQPQEPRP